MDPEQLLVWLEAVPDAVAPLRTGVVCRRHADAMMVPRGWTLDDRRESRPRLFRVASDDATSELRRIKRPTRRRNEPETVEPQLSFAGEVTNEAHEKVSAEERAVDDVVVGDFLPPVSVDADETQAIPWRPVFDETDDLSGLLQAESPLLSRAFRGLARDQPPNT